jgi:hypothetical protein
MTQRRTIDGVPYEEQQLSALSWDQGILDLPDTELAVLAARLRAALA